MAANLADILVDLGAALATIDGLTVYPFPPNSAVITPFAYPGLPTIDYDLTYGRASDRFTFSIYVGVSASVDAASAAALSDLMGSDTENSIKAALESYDSQVWQSLRVTSVSAGELDLSHGQYAGAIFQLDLVA